MLKSITHLPLLNHPGLPVSSVYKTDHGETWRCAELTNTLQSSLLSIPDATFVMDGVCVGQGIFPRIRPGENGLLHLYASYDVVLKVKDGLLTLTNRQLAPVMVDLSVKIRGRVTRFENTLPLEPVLTHSDDYGQVATLVTFRGLLRQGDMSTGWVQ